MTRASAASSPANPAGLASDYSLPEVLRRVGRLEVRAARVVDGFLNGRHHSPYQGRSLEFREHREYAAGDDLRHVDWKALGRQDKLFVKQYEEETNLRATLLVDCSASMAFRGEHDALSKHEYAATAATALAYLLAAQHDAIACRAFAGEVLSEAPHRTGRRQVSQIAEILQHTLDTPSESAQTDLGALLLSTAESIPRRGVVILVSDLLCPVEQLAEGLEALRARRHDAIVLHVLSTDEIDFPIEGPTRFIGLEGGATLDTNPRALRSAYLSAMQDHLSAIEAACASAGAERHLVRTSDPLDSILAPMLIARRGAKRSG